MTTEIPYFQPGAARPSDDMHIDNFPSPRELLQGIVDCSADPGERDFASAMLAEAAAPISECYGDCSTGDAANCPNPCKFEGRPTRLPNVVLTAPAQIYLVIGEDCPPEEDFKVLASAAGEDLTWCEDKIDANSIGYVREDLAARQELLDACMAMIAWDDAEKAARPWNEDGGKSWHERLDACALAFEKARAAVAKVTGAQA